MAFHVKTLFLRGNVPILLRSTYYCVQKKVKQSLSNNAFQSAQIHSASLKENHHFIPGISCRRLLIHENQNLGLYKWAVNSQSTDSSSLPEEKKSDDISTKDEVEYDKLFRSMEIECRGSDPAVLRSYSKFLATSANHLQIKIDSIDFPKYKVTRWTVLKSVFVHKKHRVQYEVRTHFLIVRFLQLTSSTADTFLEYVQRNLPEGVSMKVTKEELLPLPEFVKGSDQVSPRYS